MTTHVKESTLADLAQLAGKANRHHAQYREALRSMLLHAKGAGMALLAAKRQLRHGKFGQWIDQHCAKHSFFCLKAVRWDWYTGCIVFHIIRRRFAYNLGALSNQT